ncbi:MULTISPECIES: CAP domain-containing protein [unclassified Nocardioides]|uniref:CAP domain-containing protein n=1 Tax=unclassified Nocardioides TaxID=2615069 RepID=UPI003014E7D3
MNRVLATALAVLLLALVVPSTAPAAAATAEQRYSNAAFSSTNAQREQRDRAELRKNRCLTRFAVKQAKRMARQREIFHQDLGPILRRCGLSMVGENVAVGYTTGRSVVREGWMKSEGHRANILQPRYRLMGIGARKAGGSWYVAQVFGRK